MLALGLIEVIGLPPAMEAADAALKAANVKLLAIAKADAGILTVEITGDVGAVTAAVDAGAAAASRVGTLRAKHIIPRVDDSLVGKVIMQGTKLFQPKGKATGKTIGSNKDIDSANAYAGSEYTIDKNSEVEGSKRDDSKSYEDRTNDGVITDHQEDTDQSKVTVTGSNTENTQTTDTTKVINQTANNQIYNDQTTNTQTTNNQSEEDQKTDTIKYTEAELKRLNNDALRDILQTKGVKLTNKHMNAKKQDLIELILTMQNNR